ncbi:MAG: hypothetical protein GTO46_13810 [Gemmatimonadetes bacterium]|nr:hypothetical protein [Gemmatimonadota bacterium]NIO32660.1 hypothetical protein [Gemmatimonadota bacterium]
MSTVTMRFMLLLGRTLLWAAATIACLGCEGRSGAPKSTTGPAAFSHLFGGTGTEVGNAVRQLADGGYVVVGYTTSFGAGEEDVWLLRTDAAGDTLWTRTFGGPGKDWGWDVRATRDGGYMIVGFTNSFGAGGDDVYLIRTDAEGDALWSRTYGGPDDELAWAFHETSDDGYVIAAQTESFGAGERDLYLLRIDASGDTAWTRTLGGPGIDRVFAAEPTSDGGSVFAGITSNGPAGPLDATLVRIDSVGEVIWAYSYGGEGRDIGHGVASAPDGGFLLVGYTDSFGAGNNDIYLVRTDETGAALWTRTVGDAGDDRAMMGAPMTGGGYAIAGYASGSEGYWSAKLTAVSDDGTALWSETFGSSGTDRGVMLQETADGAFIFTGGIWSERDEAPDLFLSKIPAGGTADQSPEVE